MPFCWFGKSAINRKVLCRHKGSRTVCLLQFNNIGGGSVSFSGFFGHFYRAETVTIKIKTCVSRLSSWENFICFLQKMPSDQPAQLQALRASRVGLRKHTVGLPLYNCAKACEASLPTGNYSAFLFLPLKDRGLDDMGFTLFNVIYDGG